MMLTKLCYISALIFILLTSRTGLAQNINEMGKPFLTNWAPKDYNAHPQNWEVVQDNRGVMYFANYNGVLEFDGVSWRLNHFGNVNFTRSLAIAKDGTLYVGGKNEIGYFLPEQKFIKNSKDKNPFERPFISLINYLQPEDRKFMDVWKIAISSQGVFFQTNDCLFRYVANSDQPRGNSSLNNSHKASGFSDEKDSLREGRMHVWKSKNGFSGMGVVDDCVYVAQLGTGLMKVMGDSLKLVPGGENIGHGFKFILPFSDNHGRKKILIGTMDHGLFWFDGLNCMPLAGNTASFLKEMRITSGEVLSDGTIAIATLNYGVIIFDPSADGTIRQMLNKNSGLRNDVVSYLFLDKEGGLWLALDNGISRVEMPSPLSFFDENHGLKGAGSAIIKHNNTLYIGTDAGLYYLNASAKIFVKNTQDFVSNNVTLQPEFKPVEGLKNRVWTLLVVPETGELLAGNEKSLYRIHENKAELLMRFDQDITTLHHSNLDANRVYIGLRYGGLATARHASGRSGAASWINEGKIPGINDYIRNIAESEDGSLWLTAKYEKYLIRVVFQQASTTSGEREMKKVQIQYFDKAAGLPDKRTIDAIVLAGQLYAIPASTLYRFDAHRSLFIPDNKFFVSPDTSIFIETMVEDKSGNIWFEYDHALHVARIKKDGSYEHEVAPFQRVDRQAIYRIYPDENGVVWYCGTDMLIRYDGKVNKNYKVDFEALIRRVATGKDSIIFDGLPIADGETKLSLQFTYNTLRFECAAPSYDNLSANQFEYFLEGFDNGWSPWTKETKKDYTNLPEGDYKFRVRAKNIYQYVSREAVYSFIILPPWWRTWWAYGVYALVLGLLIFMVDRVQRQRLIKKERERAEIRETKLRSQTVEAENKMLQSENERKELELRKSTELKTAYTELKNTHENLKATQQQLVTQQKLASLGALTAGIAHEIKNPLNFVNNFAELSTELLDELSETLESQRDKLSENKLIEIKDLINNLKTNLSKISNHGSRADSIVKGMLLHSRGSTGEKVLTNINDLLDQYVNLAYHGLRAQNKEFNITIEKDYDDTLQKINVVPQDISRVFLNIINNACYAANEKKQKSGKDFAPILKVSTKNLQDKVEVRIRDNGNGIPVDLLDKIFQPFFTTKPTGEGTGLGLSLSYDIITKVHGGEIKVETKEGEGTKFIIILKV